MSKHEEITSVDGALGDLAPYEGEFVIAYQEFRAQSNRITYAGVTVGDPALPMGPVGDKLILSICSTATCSAGTLASEEVPVDNYGLTSVEFDKEIDVVSGETYYLVWKPPSDDHGVPWLTFWHGSRPNIDESSQMEAVVRGYEYEGKVRHSFRGEVASYLDIQAPPAPHAGPFVYAYQGFIAASNRISKLGVVVGNRNEGRGKVSPDEIKISLCSTPRCTGGALASAESHVVNFGVTDVNFEGVAVIPGETYYVNWEAPEEYEGEPWITFWFGDDPLLEDATSMEALAEGYDETPLTYQTPYFSERPEGGHSVEVVSNYEEASGVDEDSIGPNQVVEVSCKIFDPAVEWSEPEGFWYRIHSSPWDDQYYAAANEFQNTSGAGESISVDANVPYC